MRNIEKIISIKLMLTFTKIRTGLNEEQVAFIHF